MILRLIRLFFVVLFLSSCAGTPPPPLQVVDDIVEKAAPLPEPEIDSVPVIREDFITIVAVGDNIIHDPILAAYSKNGEYNFDSIYDKIKAYILPADIAFVNQETVLGNSALGYSGYPLFSTPPQAGAALTAAGFNLVNHASNHIMDRGEAGILSCIDYWDSVEGVEYLGIHRSEAERENRKIIIEKNNFKIGFLSYTYGTNGIPLPRGKSYLVSLIEGETIAAEIDALRPLCDYLVVSMHWGDEYRTSPSREQERLAALLAEHGVDLVIGHHPHVPQPFAAIDRPDGGVMNVFYSLGNFLSAHARPVKDALWGGLMYAKLKKADGEISVEEIGLIPVITHYDVNQSAFTIYPIAEYTEDLAAKHWNRARDREMTLDHFVNRAQELFGGAW